MARPQKPHVNFSCKLDRTLAERLKKTSDKTRMTQTALMERALEKYLDEYDMTGKL